MDYLVPALQFFGIAALLVALYFFTVTRLALAVKSFTGRGSPATAGLYWLYTNRFLIRLTDNRLVVSAVLLFQYDKLVARVVEALRALPPQARVLQISCAYGNFSEKLAEGCRARRARELVVCDIVGSQLDNVRRKLKACPANVTLVEEDAARMRFADRAFDCALVFFLLHELPLSVKRRALEEAMRVVRPGGRLVIAEFHRPRSRLMRLFGRLYFSLFEPFALDMWDRFDPAACIRADAHARWTVERETLLLDNFQVVCATREAA